MIVKSIIGIVFLAFGLFGSGCNDNGMIGDDKPTDAVKVEKTNPTNIYMHYMPWFHSKEVSGYWGSHWRMGNKNPDIILSNGQREIAAHYYPLIGPYDSSDPDVIDYHMLLLKYAGVDGILIDWYGSHSVLDYGTNLKNSNAIIAGAESAGVGFGIVYEEFTAEEVERRKNLTDIEAAQADVNYMEANYFTSDLYLEVNDRPLVLTFGPRYFRTKEEWTEIFEALDGQITFLPLWGHRHRVGDVNSSGEFSWVDFSAPLDDLNGFYQNSSGLIIGSAFPGFHDYYEQGGWGDSYGFVDHKDGETLARTLDKASQFNVSHLQLVTWNDFGEGTMFEPTVEFEFKYLEMLQEFTGVSYTRHELELIHDYFLKRKEFAQDPNVNSTLDEVYDALNRLEVKNAEELLSSI